MTDASQSVVWDAYYWPVGEIRSITGTASNNLRFPGQYYLVEYGLHYNWHRHYDPTLGRFIQADSLGFVGGPSVYAYVGSNPVFFVDPTGLERKPGKTSPSRWPDLPPNLAGKKPKWNPNGYWECPGNRDLTWDDRSHGAGADRGKSPQGGHWDDENSGNRWDEDGNALPGSPDYQFADPSVPPGPTPWYAPPPWLAPLGAAGTLIWILILVPK